MINNLHCQNGPTLIYFSKIILSSVAVAFVAHDYDIKNLAQDNKVSKSRCFDYWPTNSFSHSLWLQSSRLYLMCVHLNAIIHSFLTLWDFNHLIVDTQDKLEFQQWKLFWSQILFWGDCHNQTNILISWHDISSKVQFLQLFTF